MRAETTDFELVERGLEPVAGSESKGPSLRVGECAQGVFGSDDRLG